MKTNLCSEKLKVLSNAERLKILSLLSEKTVCVTEINELLKIPQNLLSYHLKVLEENQWIKSEKKGKFNFYSGTDLLKNQRDQFNIDLGCCHIQF